MDLLQGFVDRVPERLGGGWLEDPLVCTYAHPGTGARVTVTADCRVRAKDREIESVREAVLQRQGTELGGLGRAALRVKPTALLEQVIAWGDRAPCTFSVTWHGEGREQATELMRKLLSASQDGPSRE